MRAERRGDRGAQTGHGGGGARQVVRDVVAGSEQQRYEDGPAASQGGECVGEGRLFDLDVTEPDGETGPLPLDPAQQGPDGAQGTGVTAAVGDDDEGGRG